MMKALLFVLLKWLSYEKLLIVIILIHSILLGVSATLGVGLAERPIRYADFVTTYSDLHFTVYSSLEELEDGHERDWTFELIPCIIYKGNVSTLATLLIPLSDISANTSDGPDWLSGVSANDRGIFISGDASAILGQDLKVGDSIGISIDDSKEPTIIEVSSIGPWIDLQTYSSPLIVVTDSAQLDLQVRANDHELPSAYLQWTPWSDQKNFFKELTTQKYDSTFFALLTVPLILQGFYLWVYIAFVMIYVIISLFIVIRVVKMFLLEVKKLNYQGVEHRSIQLVVLLGTITYALIVSIVGFLVYNILLSVIWSDTIPSLAWRLFAHFLGPSVVVSLGVATISVRFSESELKE